MSATRAGGMLCRRRLSSGVTSACISIAFLKISNDRGQEASGLATCDTAVIECKREWLPQRRLDVASLVCFFVVALASAAYDCHCRRNHDGCRISAGNHTE